MWEDLIGPGAIKAGLKVVDSMTGGALHGAVEMMDEITSSPAYTKHRIDQAQNTLSDFWDDHKEDVSDFFDNVGDTINNGLDAAGDFFSNAADTIGDNLGDILGSLFS